MYVTCRSMSMEKLFYTKQICYVLFCIDLKWSYISSTIFFCEALEVLTNQIQFFFSTVVLEGDTNTFTETLMPCEWLILNGNKQHYRTHIRTTKNYYCFGHVYIKMLPTKMNTPTNYAMRLFIKHMQSLMLTSDIKI